MGNPRAVRPVPRRLALQKVVSLRPTVSESDLIDDISMCQRETHG